MRLSLPSTSNAGLGHESSAVIELVLDRGEVVAGDRRSSFCEAELALKSSDSAALFDRKQERRRHRHFIAALESLQDELGMLNDMVTAPAVLTGLGIGDASDAVAVLFPRSKGRSWTRPGTPVRR
ncbi:hypothetical protein [Sphingomonas sp. MMS24-J13]|uniref:hypothetical protein n=1 Tax=Sphingomonas sp. MMS24-J13 TaxID=3238686 RepID=UPI00384A47C2